MDYHFLSVHVFEESILNNRYVHASIHQFCLFISISYHLSIFKRFVEYGRYGGHYYGTGLDSVRKVMAEGKVCLLDVHPSVSGGRGHVDVHVCLTFCRQQGVVRSGEPRAVKCC